MTSAAPRPDGVVRTALQMLPVPAHADDFWTRVEADLDGDVTARRPVVAAPPSSPLVAPPLTAPDGDPARALLPGSFRRLSNLLLLVVAVAAVVMVALAGKMLLEERNEDQSAPAAGGPDGAASWVEWRLFEAA